MLNQKQKKHIPEQTYREQKIFAISHNQYTDRMKNYFKSISNQYLNILL